MAEVTLDQQRALALASARARANQAPTAGVAAARAPTSAASAASNIPEEWRQRFEESDRMLGLPPGTTARQIQAESSFNPKAVNSRTNARGLAQITPGTQQDAEQALGRKLDPFVPNDSIDAHDFVWQRRLNAHDGNRIQAALDYGGFRDGNRTSPAARNYLTKIFGQHWIMYDHSDPAAVK